jgi:hypothetical protein
MGRIRDTVRKISGHLSAIRKKLPRDLFERLTFPRHGGYTLRLSLIMKFASFLPALLAAQAAAVALPSNSQTSKEREIVNALLENPQFLHPGSYKLLQARAKKFLSKRQSADAGVASSFFNPGNMAGLFGTLEAIIVSILPVNARAPKATVAERQTVPPQAEWPGSKRVKVRYGPYRIPPTSVGLRSHWKSLGSFLTICRRKITIPSFWVCKAWEIRSSLMLRSLVTEIAKCYRSSPPWNMPTARMLKMPMG